MDGQSGLVKTEARNKLDRCLPPVFRTFQRTSRYIALVIALYNFGWRGTKERFNEPFRSIPGQDRDGKTVNEARLAISRKRGRD